MRRALVVVVMAVTLAGPAAADQDAATRLAATGLQRKLDQILEIADRPAAGRAPARLHRTILTEPEVNAYFQLMGPSFMPDGVGNAQVVIDAGGRVRAKANVDLDKALKPRERSFLDPLAWVSGTVEIGAAGTLQSDKGQGRLTIEQATLGGIPVPLSILQEVIAAYSKTAEHPDGFKLSEPFELPAKIWTVETARGRATVVQ